jgi:tetratricopeptide (TPR) repeat protein
MDTENTIWQDSLLQGHAEEALQLFLASADSDDDATREVLEHFVSLQDYLREKNIAKARQLFTKQDSIPEWATQIVSDLVPQLATLEEALKALEKHDPDKTLSILASINSPLLLGETETLRGTALIYHNDTSGAKAAFENALGHDPKHYRALSNLGNLALEANKVDEAIGFYESALKLNEDFANAHHNLAVAYRRKGQMGKSVGALKKAQRVSQQNMREEARGLFKNKQTSKYLRWIMYVGIALVAYIVLKTRA